MIECFLLTNKILSILIMVTLVSSLPFAVAQEPTTGDQWNTLVTYLKDAENRPHSVYDLTEVRLAKSIYDDTFKSASQELDQETDDLIEMAFVDFEKNLKAKKTIEAGLNRQVIDKLIYKIAFMKIEQALDQNDVVSLMSWFTVMEKKFKISQTPTYVTNQALVEIQKSSSKIDEYSDIIKSELIGIFKLKTIEEIEEAIAAVNESKIDDARKFTYEGLYYYMTLHPFVAEKLGEESANKLLHEMQRAIIVTSSDLSEYQMIQELEHIADEAELIIREYEGIDTSGIGGAIAGMKDRLVLVDVEYKDAVANGKIINQVEYDETVIFLSKAVEIFDENKNAFLSISESDTVLIESNLSEIKRIVQSLEEHSVVQSLVIETIDVLDDFADTSGGTVEVGPLVYIEKIEKLLDQVSISYRNGDSSTALTLATAAYLDNYEFIEADIAYHDRDLMEKIEIMLREKLRDMIKNGDSPDAVDTHIDAIKQELEVAEATVPEFGSLALLILAISVLSIIALSVKNKKLNLFSKL